MQRSRSSEEGRRTPASSHPSRAPTRSRRSPASTQSSLPIGSPSSWREKRAYPATKSPSRDTMHVVRSHLPEPPRSLRARKQEFTGRGKFESRGRSGSASPRISNKFNSVDRTHDEWNPRNWKEMRKTVGARYIFTDVHAAFSWTRFLNRSEAIWSCPGRVLDVCAGRTDFHNYCARRTRAKRSVARGTRCRRNFSLERTLPPLFSCPYEGLSARWHRTTDRHSRSRDLTVVRGRENKKNRCRGRACYQF